MSEWAVEPSELREADAVRWYTSLDSDAPHALDSAIVTIVQVFGNDVDVAAVVPLDDRSDGTFLFLAVTGDVSDDETWQQLVDAHRVYATQAAQASESRERLRIVIANVPDARPLRGATEAWFFR